jgi:hypothetical protein
MRCGQPYGQIFIMNSDGTDKRILTDNLWDDSMPLSVPGLRAPLPSLMTLAATLISFTVARRLN